MPIKKIKLLSGKWLAMLIIIAGLFGAIHVFGAYYPIAYLVSSNLLSSQIATSIDSFSYTASAIPANTTLKFQFSLDGSTWYNSSGTRDGWDTLSVSTNNTIGLASLGWSGSSFYYRIKFTSDGTDTPVLDEVGIIHSASTATWTGSSSSDWSDDANWDIGSAPGSYHNIIIPSSSTVNLSSDVTVNSLTIQSGGELNLNGYNLTVANTFSNNGTLRLQGDETLSLTADTDSGTVEYDGSGSYSSLPYGNTYNNLTFSGTGTWTLNQ